MAVENPTRRFLAPLTVETIGHPHTIIEPQIEDDLENDERRFLCKTSTGERWRLTIPLSQLIYPNQEIYDFDSLDKLLKSRMPSRKPPTDKFQLGQDHGLNFATYPGVSDHLSTFISVDEGGDPKNILYPPSTYTEIAMNGDANAERMDLAIVLSNGAIMGGELSTLGLTLSRKHKQIREYCKKMKALLVEAGLKCDIIPFYIRCGYDSKIDEYSLKFRRVKKDPQSNDFTEPF